MGNFTTTTKNTMLNSITVDRISLHSGDPGGSGTSNELTGGSYARGVAVFNAAASGERILNADVTIDVPAGSTVSYIGLWDNNGGTPIYRGFYDATDETFASAGQCVIKATNTKLRLPDLV